MTRSQPKNLMHSLGGSSFRAQANFFALRFIIDDLDKCDYERARKVVEALSHVGEYPVL
ncbi:hypothetical protein IMCC3088_567 [Aequoribacter fuscus]|uniref:Uncharacterized protein n=1 Tax=Aequoribacter fuscus TaxID=2518989 RepID=F3L5Y8_9GAMM|nr:hypothetical protein IMCC3088_567 [Aequoribacter fuscus]